MTTMLSWLQARDDYQAAWLEACYEYHAYITIMVQWLQACDDYRAAMTTMLTVEFRDEDVDRASEGSLVLEVGTQCTATTNEI